MGLTLPCFVLAYNWTPPSATGLPPCDVMIGKNRIRNQDLDLAETSPLNATPSMTKGFRLLNGRAAAPLGNVKNQQKAYEGRAKKPFELP